jgi:peptide/nickel transport system permease protein
MRTYIIRRVLLMIPTLFLLTVAVFMIVRALPGDVVETIVGQYTPLTQGDRNQVRHELGIDRPWYQQYGDFIGNAFKGDLGTSLVNQQPITKDLKRRVPVSVELGAMALFIGVIIAVPVGVLAAIRQDTLIDYFTRSSAIALIAIPSFWLGTMVEVYPNIWWNWAPPIQYHSFLADPQGNLYILIFPATILGIGLSGAIMRLTRAEMLEVLRQDYVRTAWSKGLRERTVVMRHALRNTLIPVTTLIALQIPVLIGGTVVLEGIFSIPGMGAYLLSAASSKDFPVIQAVTLLVGIVVVVSNLAVDIAYAYLDPRIRYS